MARLTFVGAAGTVTGSKHLVETQGRHFLVDCGLFQGPADVVALNAEPLPVAPSAIEAIVLTHGHIDHVGYVPKIVKDGFRGPIYCTPPTAAVVEIVLEDAAGLQQHLAAKNALGEKPHSPPPLYDAGDVAQALKQLHTVPLHQTFDVCGASVAYKNAGHIIGSAFAETTIEGRRVVFSGDIGRYGRPLLYDPENLSTADTVVCEATYGDRIHPPDPLGALRDALVAAVARGGTIVIPAFAVERTQDLLLALGTLQKTEPALASVPVYVDSPMAIKVDRVFLDFPDAYRPVPNSPGAPFGAAGVTLAITTDQSKALNALGGPAIVISSSGMASGGRVLHHIRNHVADPKSTILFCGFQGPGTLGNYLSHAPATLKIFGETVAVRAHIALLSGYSGHADQNELLRWLGTAPTKPTLYLVHGDPDTVSVFATVAHQRLGLDARPGVRGTTISL